MSNNHETTLHSLTAIIVGAGPSGLMAADVLTQYGAKVFIHDAAASPARKLLLAGRSGLNLTHSEDCEIFLSRYGVAAERLAPALRLFSSQDLRNFCAELGEETFVGSSGRVFPKNWKATPFLRAWLRRLEQRGVEFVMRSRFVGFHELRAPVFLRPDGARQTRQSDILILACGGGSWRRLAGSWPHLAQDEDWADAFRKSGFAVTPLTPANCGVYANWSTSLLEKHEGAPVKNLAFSFEGRRESGEAVITRRGLEGGPIYALSSAIRARLAQNSAATLTIDFKPAAKEDALALRLSSRRAKDSLSNALRKLTGLSPASIGLLREAANWPQEPSPHNLAALIKSARFPVHGVAGLERAISSAGGLSFDELDEDFMLKKAPGVFAAGEMLDWDAPTGGYLLQACFSTGFYAGKNAFAWLEKTK